MVWRGSEISLIVLQPSFIGKEVGGFHNTSFKYKATLTPAKSSTPKSFVLSGGTTISFQNVMKCDVYIRQELHANVVLSSDTAMFQGTGKHMFKEL